MKTIIKGLKVTKTWRVDKCLNKDSDGNIVFYSRPHLISEDKTECVNISDINPIDGDICFNSNKDWGRSVINISENESVTVNKTVFRADLNEQHVITNKIVEGSEVYEEAAKDELKLVLKDFNKKMIGSNSGMKSYCELHKLIPEETDACELFKLVYPNEDYKIENGKMVVEDRSDALSFFTTDYSHYKSLFRESLFRG